MERAEGVRFMLLDTCHAANAFNPRLEKDAADARIVVFSATAANNTALELAELGHGVFTYSILAGLRGEAKTSQDGVTLFGLADYISRQIVELTGARQKPYYYVSGIDNMLIARAVSGRRVALLRRSLLWLGACVPALAAPPACPPGDDNFPAFYSDPALFENAMDKVAAMEPSNERLTGIIVPHHLLADRLVALGFKAASGFRYKRIVILSPDHFRKAEKPFATTTRGFDDVFGPVRTDAQAAARLLDGQATSSRSPACSTRTTACAPCCPSSTTTSRRRRSCPSPSRSRSDRADWDRMGDALATIVDADTLVVESTDFSHYLPQHVARGFDQQTLNVLAAGSLDAIAALRQPAHADSVGALYIQTQAAADSCSAQRRSSSPTRIRRSIRPTMSPRRPAIWSALFGRFGAGVQQPRLGGRAHHTTWPATPISAAP